MLLLITAYSVDNSKCRTNANRLDELRLANWQIRNTSRLVDYEPNTSKLPKWKIRKTSRLVDYEPNTSKLANWQIRKSSRLDDKEPNTSKLAN